MFCEEAKACLWPRIRHTPIFPLFSAILNLIQIIWSGIAISGGKSESCADFQMGWVIVGMVTGMANIAMAVFLYGKYMSSMYGMTHGHKLFARGAGKFAYVLFGIWLMVWMIVAGENRDTSSSDACKKQLNVQLSFYTIFFCVGGAFLVMTYLRWRSVHRVQDFIHADEREAARKRKQELERKEEEERKEKEMASKVPLKAETLAAVSQHEPNDAEEHTRRWQSSVVIDSPDSRAKAAGKRAQGSKVVHFDGSAQAKYKVNEVLPMSGNSSMEDPMPPPGKVNNLVGNGSLNSTRGERPGQLSHLALEDAGLMQDGSQTARTRTSNALNGGGSGQHKGYTAQFTGNPSNVVNPHAANRHHQQDSLEASHLSAVRNAVGDAPALPVVSGADTSPQSTVGGGRDRSLDYAPSPQSALGVTGSIGVGATHDETFTLHFGDDDDEILDDFDEGGDFGSSSSSSMQSEDDSPTSHHLHHPDRSAHKRGGLGVGSAMFNPSSTTNTKRRVSQVLDQQGRSPSEGGTAAMKAVRSPKSLNLDSTNGGGSGAASALPLGRGIKVPEYYNGNLLGDGDGGGISGAASNGKATSDESFSVGGSTPSQQLRSPRAALPQGATVTPVRRDPTGRRIK